jgi:DNA polymerase-1
MGSFKRVIFDVEADGLLDTATRMWICNFICVETLETKEFLEGDMGWKEVIDNCDAVIGHFLVGFDFPLLKKLFKYEPPKHVKVIDTLILSQVLNYRRFGYRGHSLDEWGKHLGHPKPAHEDWSQFSEEMRHRNREDCQLNLKVYRVLKDELKFAKSASSKITTYLDVEHAVSKWCSLSEEQGWPFDLEKAHKLERELFSKMSQAYAALVPKLGTKTVPYDKVGGEVEVKKPRWNKDGSYEKWTASWFNVDPWSGYEGEERMIDGEYCRVTFEPLSLGSVSDVKIFLFRNGWQPTEWNFKDVDGKKVKSSPKITEDSLEFLGGDGKLYLEFSVAKSRHAILKTWLDEVTPEGRLHGRCVSIGTPSFRARHSIIVNIPSVDSAWGKEMRELFTCQPGWKLIGCDSSGNQARGLAYYLKNPEFTNTLINGDIHQFNADVLSRILKAMGVDYVVKRSQAKRILYAFLFGASGAKLWSYIFEVLNASKGKTLKTEFIKAVPGFKSLLEKLEAIYFSTSKGITEGYIYGVAGQRIYVDSSHKLLVYLLQSLEKVTCGAALMLLMNRLEEHNIPYIPHIFMHDEVQFEVPEEHAPFAAELGKLCFKEGPALFNVNIMDGDSRIGNNWFETH